MKRKKKKICKCMILSLILYSRCGPISFFFFKIFVILSFSFRFLPDFCCNFLFFSTFFIILSFPRFFLCNVFPSDFCYDCVSVFIMIFSPDFYYNFFSRSIYIFFEISLFSVFFSRFL